MAPEPLLPNRLVYAGDDPGVLRLFAETLDFATQATQAEGRRSIIIPGPFWLLARRAPSSADLSGLLAGASGEGWPPWFGRNLPALSRDPVANALAHCLRRGPSYGVGDGRDLCRIIAAVAQTLNSTNLAIVQRNRALAETAPAPSLLDWSDEEAFVSTRPDERGGYLQRSRMRLWMAAHTGPRHAERSENQDAVCALPSQNGFVFALADGVGTSLGSRYGAAKAAHHFCVELQRLRQDRGEPRELLLEACRRTQEELDQILDRMLADESHPVLAELQARASMHPRAVAAVLWNTKTAEKEFLAPALATTLIGGFIERSGSGARAALLCIGDGAVELAGPDRPVSQFLLTDPEVLTVAAMLGPGPRARESLGGPNVEIGEVELRTGDHLLLSSDGLARGHSQPVWTKIQELAGDTGRLLERREGSAAAADLLCALANAADSRGDRLFGDNLSLIIVGVD